jgi:ABC-type glycerol-3-phosphate transport system permease component
VASLAAFVLSKTDYKGKKIIFLVVQFSLLYNAYTLAIPQYLIFSKLHLINTYLVYILPYLPSSLGVFLIKQYIDDSIPDTLLEAAKIDGAGYFRTYWHIVMPIIKPAWMTLALFAFRDMWGMSPSGTIFNEELKTLPTIMGQVVSGGIARAGNAMAVSVLLMIPPVIVYLITQSNVIETMSSAGIKD